MISAAFGVASIFVGPKWKVSETEATPPAKPLLKMIEGVAKHIPGLTPVIKSASQPLVFGSEMGQIYARRANEDAPAAPPAQPTMQPSHAAQNGRLEPSSAGETMETRRLTVVEKFRGIVNE